MAATSPTTSGQERDALCYRSATEQAALIRSRQLSPLELLEAHLARIAERDDAIGAFVTLLEDDARDAAKAAERAVASDAELGPLHGVPVALKDIEPMAGVRNTIGSRLFAEHVAPDDGIHVGRLRGAGALLIGKTNVSEFGHKGVTDNLLFGPTSTPFDLTSNAGGSSGGSAAAVAAGFAPLGQGGDGGGSVRIPAALCGVYGLKPTWGRIPAATRPNAFQMHTPMCHIGTLSRTVADAALMLRVLAGPDPRDPFSLPATDDADAWSAVPVERLRIAYSPDLGSFPIDPRVAAVVEEAVRALERAGAQVERVEVDLGRPHGELMACWKRAAAVLYADMVLGFGADRLQAYSDRRDEVAPEFVELVEQGRSLTALEHRHDDVIRTGVLDGIERVLATHDLLLTPTVCVPAVRNAPDGSTLGPSEVEGEPVDPLLGWALAYPLNFTGHPAASAPAGLTSEGHPVGLQVIGRRFREDMVLAVSAALERVRPWQDHYARLRAPLPTAAEKEPR